MAQPDDLETRVAVLETQVREPAERVRHSEQDAAAARVLAGGARPGRLWRQTRGSGVGGPASAKTASSCRGLGL